MPRKKTRPEMSWVEEKRLWRKKLKHPDTGQYVSVYGQTKQEVREKAAARLAAWSVSAEVRERPDFAALALRWATLTAADVSPKVRKYRSSALNNHILPVLGESPAAELKNEEILALKSSLSSMSRDSQTKILNVVRNICAFGLRNGYMDQDPTLGVKAGGPPPAEVDPLTQEQTAALLAAVAGTQTETFCRLCLYAGLRREEALGLRWDCVDLDGPAPHLSVRRALRWPTNAAPEISETLKSEAARRDIPLPHSLVEHLKSLQAAQTSEYVLHNKTGGPMSYSSFRSMWRLIEARTAGARGDGPALAVGDKIRNHAVTVSLDFQVHPHQLRHTYCTRLILGGVDVKRTQYLMGHANARITLDIYTKLLGNRPEDTISAVRSVFD